MRQRSQIYTFDSLRGICNERLDEAGMNDYQVRRKLTQVFNLLYSQLKTPLLNYLTETNAKEAI